MWHRAKIISEHISHLCTAKWYHLTWKWWRSGCSQVKTAGVDPGELTGFLMETRTNPQAASILYLTYKASFAFSSQRRTINNDPSIWAETCCESPVFVPVRARHGDPGTTQICHREGRGASADIILANRLRQISSWHGDPLKQKKSSFAQKAI